MSGGVLAICETVGQAEMVAFARPAATIVAFTPAVDAWRERIGRADPSIEDLCDERRLAAVGADLTDVIEDLAERVAVLAKPILGPLDPHGDLSLRGFFHFLRTHIDGVVIRLEQILAAIDALSPGEIIVFDAKPWRMTGLTCLDKPVLGLTQNLLPRIAAARRIEILRLKESPHEEIPVEPPLSQSSETPADIAPAESDAKLLEAAPAPEDDRHAASAAVAGIVARFMARLGLKKKASEVFSEADPKPVLLTSLFSDLGTAIGDVWTAKGGEMMGMGGIPFDDADADRSNDVRSRCEQLWDAIRVDPAIGRILTHKGIDIRPEMFAQIEPIVSQRFPAMWSDAVRFDRWFSARRAVVLLGGVVDTHYVLARSAARHGSPVVSYHYGGFLGFSLLPIHERYDLAECDYFLCGGPLASETFTACNPEVRWREGVRRAAPLPLGAPWIADLLRIARRNDPNPRPVKRVMVVLNALLGDCRYLGRVFPPEIEYWRFTRRLIERLAADQIELIIKPPLQDRYLQQRNPVEDWIEDRRFPNVSFLRERPLADCLDEADAFVLESPSTPLLQLVTTRAPLALYVNRDIYRLVPAARELLARRCGVFAESETDFFSGLENWLADIRAGRVQTDGVVDDGFLSEVCTGPGAPITTGRIVAFLKDIYAGVALDEHEIATSSRWTRQGGADGRQQAHQTSLAG